MAKIVVCDVCGKQGIAIVPRDIVTPWRDAHGNYSRRTVDLCNDCRKDVDRELLAASRKYDDAWKAIINSRGWSGDWCKRKEG